MVPFLGRCFSGWIGMFTLGVHTPQCLPFAGPRIGQNEPNDLERIFFSHVTRGQTEGHLAVGRKFEAELEGQLAVSGQRLEGLERRLEATLELGAGGPGAGRSAGVVFLWVRFIAFSGFKWGTQKGNHLFWGEGLPCCFLVVVA